MPTSGKMQIKNVISFALRIALTAAFLVFLIKSLIRLTSDETGTRTFKENDFHFPSITVCPIAYDTTINGITLGSGKTFQDFQELPSFRDHVEAAFDIMEPYSLDYSK